ncbi:hypothetical protein HanXRQr2_Chr11g0518711 [Helianthus annuus]|uniref:Uncharacterized protein n=1 Tax=Helianthus annuus TaxID=4232 RepID=A0A9K3HTR6_HELAN|nr:hypothetical protein HanXRQr2_Chr11g0518711 [Helianthus annuus]KAJ0877418.1 hypothetical protein HanPSC8_Chr11g0499921 [Helianthus annuus]
MCPMVPHSKHDLRSTNPEESCDRLADDVELCEPEVLGFELLGSFLFSTKAFLTKSKLD